MLRSLPAVLAVLAVVVCGAETAWAQEATRLPDVPLPIDPVQFPRGAGYYYSLLKLGLTWALFLLWVKSIDWMNQDAQRIHFANYRNWNLAAFLPFVLFFLLLWLIPGAAAFWVGWPLMLVAYLAPFITYVVKRNKSVLSDADMVFTLGHLRYWLSVRLAKVGVKIAAEAANRRKGAPVDLTAIAGATSRDNQVFQLKVKQLPGQEFASQSLAEAIDRRGQAMLFEFSADSVALRYQIDGVWHAADPIERAIGDAELAIYKTIAGLDVAQRQARQQGVFQATYNGAKYLCRLTSQGTKTGERVLVQLDDGSLKKKRLVDLGFRQKMLDDFKAVLETRNGLVVLSAPPGHGLTTLFSATVASMDRFIRGFVGVEDVSKRELDVENVPITTYDSAAKQSPATILPKLVREYPDVYAIADMVNAEALQIMCGEAADERLVITTNRARDSVESLLNLLALKAPVTKVAPVLLAALNQRLVRKLCEKCREPYPPPPEALKQMGIPAGRVEAFYRPPQPPANANEVCEECGGLGYKGRAAIFELLVLDDVVRELLRTAPQAETIRRAARKNGLRSLQEEGVVLVAKGVTSLQELMRALKE
jgi:type II secretory ATPase GspE/PulE/Tfp pilus assembly ATPase PilB-like protein